VQAARCLEKQLTRKRYWSTGIRIEYTSYHGPAWGGEVDFFDDNPGDQDPAQGAISTYGRLQTRYFVPSKGSHRDALTAVTDTLITEVEQFGIEFRDPTLYATGEGVDPDYPLPEGWVDLFEEQTDRLGWTRPPYRSAVDSWGRPRLRVLD
jgi:hypothetical protein